MKYTTLLFTLLLSVKCAPAQKLSIAAFGGISANTDWVQGTFDDWVWYNYTTKGTIANPTYGIRAEALLNHFSVGAQLKAPYIASREPDGTKYYLGKPSLMATAYGNYNLHIKKALIYLGLNGGVFANSLLRSANTPNTPPNGSLTSEQYRNAIKPVTLTFGGQIGAKRYISTKAYILVEASANYMTLRSSTHSYQWHFGYFSAIVGMGLDIL